MLATLIALVHRFEAHLPGERAALYDICVRTLIETWPSNRRCSPQGRSRIYRNPFETASVVYSESGETGPTRARSS
ncbi:MAG: hypothetical protein GY856_51295 [bacterium]|nr:hypothetical protein [bacterium]